MPGRAARALIWGFALALFAVLVPGPLRAQDPQAGKQDLQAGKSAAELFAATCTACHRSPRGLAKGRNAMMLSGFLRQHYTTGREPAAQLAAYVAAAGGEPAAARRPPTGAPATPPTDAQRQKPEAAERTASAPATAPRRRPRQKGEIATVSSDPEPVTISTRPQPVVHDRAASRAQELRAPPPRPEQTVAAVESGVPPSTGASTSVPSGSATTQAPQPFEGPLP